MSDERKADSEWNFLFYGRGEEEMVLWRIDLVSEWAVGWFALKCKSYL